MFPEKAISLIIDIFNGQKVDPWEVVKAVSDLLSYAYSVKHATDLKLIGLAEPKDINVALNEALATKALPPWLIPMILNVLQVILENLNKPK